jgi:hypothetical protein
MEEKLKEKTGTMEQGLYKRNPSEHCEDGGNI